MEKEEETEELEKELPPPLPPLSGWAEERRQVNGRTKG